MVKSHRVGTITLGGMLISFGILFLLRLFIPTLSFEIIFRLWPIIFIILGVEILFANFREKQEKLVYDKTALCLIIVLSFFAMGMAITEVCINYANSHIAIY